jgi:putative mRNA 3-end processing factor
VTRLLQTTDAGLYCPQGNFHIDPWRPVERAVITHAHADHARPGSAAYLAATPGQHLMRTRLGADIDLQGLDYGETLTENGVTVSLHPAGHVLGSAQIRLEYQGEIAVVAGDYKVTPDPTCATFEPVKCHTFVTESTFGLPIYRWQTSEEIFAGVNRWWRANRDAQKTSVIFAYALGKAQRVMAGVDASIGPIYLHGATEIVTRAYRASGVALPETKPVSAESRKHEFAGSLVIAPPSAAGTPWMRKFEPYSDAMASGWMRVRGTRRRRALDRGFVLSDHADWPGLLWAIEATGADNILVTHGSTHELARYLRERGKNAGVLATHFQGEADEPTVNGAEAVE